MPEILNYSTKLELLGLDNDRELNNVLRYISHWLINVLFYNSFFSAVNTPSCKLAKLLVPVSTHLTSNEYTLKESLSLRRNTMFDSAHYVTSFVIESLFTNILWEETSNIYVDKLSHKKQELTTCLKILLNLYWNWLF